MADEIRVSTGLRAIKGDNRVEDIKADRTYTWGGTHKSANTQTVGTTHEALELAADLGTKGWATLMNLDTINYVTLGIVVSATYYPVIRLKPGERCVLRLEATATLYAKADTAAVALDVLVLED